jgi:hypothetical protein
MENKWSSHGVFPSLNEGDSFKITRTPGGPDAIIKTGLWVRLQCESYYRNFGPGPGVHWQVPFTAVQVASLGSSVDWRIFPAALYYHSIPAPALELLDFGLMMVTIPSKTERRWCYASDFLSCVALSANWTESDELNWTASPGRSVPNY